VSFPPDDVEVLHTLQGIEDQKNANGIEMLDFRVFLGYLVDGGIVYALWLF
jgi:hypothetical protein